MAHTDPRAVLERLVAKCGSQSKAADKLGVSRQYVSQMLKGKRIPDSMLEQLGLRRTVVAMEK